MALYYPRPAPGVRTAARAPACRHRAPNILFILTENHGAHLSFLGTQGLQTPHMDALALGGTYFNNAFVA